MLLEPRGVGEVPILVAASLGPRLLSGVPARVLTAMLTVVFGAVVGWISGNLLGLLGAAAVPLLAVRARDRVALRRERDRATALLDELRARRDAELRAAELAERARIARDLHDVLAHTLSGLSLHLQAIRAVAARTGLDAEIAAPLERAAELARTGLDEAREVTSALREPPAGADRIAELVAGHPSAELVTTGEPQQLDEKAGVAAAAAVREALTNAGRYAPGAPVTVRLRWERGGVRVQVADDGPAPGHTPAPRGGGLGLTGMSERVGEAGGTLSAGPSGPGWLVELWLPTRTERAESTAPAAEVQR